MGKRWTKIEGFLLMAGGVISAGSALMLLIYVGYRTVWERKVFSFVWLAIFLILVAFTALLASTIISAINNRDEAKKRFAYYQIVTFLILVLSLLAFAFHHIEGGRQPPAGQNDPGVAGEHNDQISAQSDDLLDVPRNVAEMSAIMVLFLLAELAAFIANDLIKARTTLDTLDETVGTAATNTKNAAATIQVNLQRLDKNAESIKQLQLVISIASLHPDVFHETVDLVKAWGDRVPASLVSKNQNPGGAQDYAVSNQCWRILLREYLKEELIDIAPPMSFSARTSPGIPASVMPIDEIDIMTLSEDDRKRISHTKPGDFSFIATTVGFYAKLLAKLVDGLSKAAEELSKETQQKQKLCMAIVTNMLPAHCWDWPMPDRSWRSYDPINSYRESMLKAVSKSAQIDRVLLVYDDPKSPFLFGADDFTVDKDTRAVRLIQKLQSEEALSKYLRNMLSDVTKQLLEQHVTTEQPTKEFLIALAEDFNRLLEDNSLHDEASFKQVILSDETKRLLNQQPGHDDLIRLNRLLLEDAYPHEIEKSLTKPSLYTAHEANEGYFWRRMLLDQMLDTWYLLSPQKPRSDKLTCSPSFEKEQGQLGTDAYPSFPFPIQCAATGESGSVYPIIVDGNSTVSFTDHAGKNWEARKLSEEYDALHGETGICWRLPLNDTSLNILNGRHDIMFIGLGTGRDEPEGLWNDEYCDWGICLMSSMNPVTETMLLTVISGESVKSNYEWCKTKLDAKMNWVGNRINRKVAEPTARPPTVPAA
jgi:hypothetical protein